MLHYRPVKRLIPFLLFLFSPSIFALAPPIGWTRVSPDRAVLDESDPTKGDILEFRIAGGNGKPEELVAKLLEKGIAIDRFGLEQNGHVNLVGPERLGRARLYWEAKNVIWWVVLVGQEHAQNIDPDALLQSLSPTPSTISWGEKQVLNAGNDGSPWGEVGALNTPSTGGWGTATNQTPWAQDSAVVGRWECNARLRGVSTRLRFYFESNGELRIQGTTDAGETVDQGNWATREGLMRMDIEKGGSNLPYMLTSSTLSVPYAGARLTLYKQQ